jgi:hypothetical protein
MPDRFTKQYPNVDSVAYDAFSITTGTSDLAFTTRSLYVGVAGNLTVMMASYDNANTIVSFNNVNAGSILPIRVKKVYANTTANSIVGLI